MKLAYQCTTQGKSWLCLCYKEQHEPNKYDNTV